MNRSMFFFLFNSTPNSKFVGLTVYPHSILVVSDCVHLCGEETYI